MLRPQLSERVSSLTSRSLSVNCFAIWPQSPEQFHVLIINFPYLFQAQPIDQSVVSALLGDAVAVSPMVTVEPTRRKFHKRVTLTIPYPGSAERGTLTQDPNLRVLCSISSKWIHFKNTSAFTLG